MTEPTYMNVDPDWLDQLGVIVRGTAPPTDPMAHANGAAMIRQMTPSSPNNRKPAPAKSCVA